MKQSLVKLVQRNVDDMCQAVTFFLCPSQSARHFGFKSAFSLRFFLFFGESARHYYGLLSVYTLYISFQLIRLKHSAIRRVYA